MAFHAPIGIMLSRLVSSSGYVLEGKEGSLCRWQSKLRPHLGINDTHVKEALNNLRQQSARLSQSPILICASSRLVNLANEELRKNKGIS